MRRKTAAVIGWCRDFVLYGLAEQKWIYFQKFGKNHCL
jgi:hypothetical protein